MTRSLVEVNSSTTIPFDWRDPVEGGHSLGRAEFSVCIKYKHGKVSEFWVDPVQTHLENMWHFPYSHGDFAITSYDDLDDPKVWLADWCKDHKAVALRVYAPSYATHFMIDSYGLSFLQRGER